MRPEERLAIDVFLEQPFAHHQAEIASRPTPGFVGLLVDDMAQVIQAAWMGRPACGRSEEHTSELQSLMRISYAVFCLKKKKKQPTTSITTLVTSTRTASKAML